MFASPASSRAGEDEGVVIQFGTVNIIAGYSHEPTPRIVHCSPLTSVPARSTTPPQACCRPGGSEFPTNYWSAWAERFENWTYDQRSSDFGVTLARLTTTIRQIYERHLLVDPRSKRVQLVLSESVPQVLCDGVVAALLAIFQIPAISCIPRSIAMAMSTGVRACLTIRIGHRYTVLSAIYDLREICRSQSSQAGLLLLKQIALNAVVRGSRASCDAVFTPLPRFDTCMRLLNQLVSHSANQDAEDRHAMILEHRESAGGSKEDPDSTCFELSQDSMRNLVRNCFISNHSEVSAADNRTGTGSLHGNDDGTIGELAYNLLARLPRDIRVDCMRNLTFSGWLSTIPGLRKGVIEDLQMQIKARNWVGLPSFSTKKSTMRGTTPLSSQREGVLPSMSPPQVSTEGAAAISTERRSGEHPVQCTLSGTWEGSSLTCQLASSGSKFVACDSSKLLSDPSITEISEQIIIGGSLR